MLTFSDWQNILNEDWYIQGFNAAPIFLNTAAYSGLIMKDKVGFGYTHFLFQYQKKYAEMGYLNDDFMRLWQIIKEKLAADSDYLSKVKKQYETELEQYEPIHKRLEQEDLTKLDDSEIIKLLKSSCRNMTDAVGIAHLIEPIGIFLEQEFKADLKNFVQEEKEYNRIFGILSTPTQSSFLALEEQELKNIAALKSNQQAAALAEHARKYFWLNNSFAGPQNIDPAQFSKRLAAFKMQKVENPSVSAAEQKSGLIKTLRLDQAIIKKIGIIDYCTIWQDERKINVLKAIGYLGKVLAELGRRLNIDPVNLYFLATTDFLNIKSIAELKSLEPELLARQAGSFFLINGLNQEEVARGSDYEKLIDYKKELEVTQSFKGTDLHGSIANGGTAIGIVKVCKNLSQIHKVQPGDILVASMTRPEYIQAIKKAAAIITDEGGITCHAAIVSRELNIPAVIGTKIATKVLKDGMKVEVKANHGLVRILENI